MTVFTPASLRRSARHWPFHPIGLPGIIARQDFRGQLLFVVSVQIVLLLVAISLDLARFFDQVISSVPEGGFFAVTARLAWYLGLRIVDMVTRLMPIAVFVGVLAFELWSVLTRRRAIHWVSGRHPMRVLMPAAAVGLVLAPLQYALETDWRPAAVLAQAAAKLGTYGAQFERNRPRKPVWFMSGDRLVHAEVRYGPPATLVDVDVYRLDDKGRVRDLIRAASAEPSGTVDVWRFRNAKRWTRDADDPMAMRVTVTPGEELLTIPLHPLAVTHMGVPAKYVPDGDLRAIVASGTDMLVGAEHRVWLEVRRANTLMPLAMALLAATVSLFAGARRPGLPVLVVCIFTGYTIHVAVRVFIAAGELDILSPVGSAWIPVAIASVGVPLFAAVAALRDWRA
ncbi:MAG: LptF/LptG family permease [Siculibacillus sp.]|nr:LptF/LptG family permease [Siculibacillus sp.]